MAQLNIFNINMYIRYTLCNQIAANNFLIGIRNNVLNLKLFPYIGTKYKNEYNRFKVYKNFLIFYEIQEKEKLIVIKRIIHRNIDTINGY